MIANQRGAVVATFLQLDDNAKTTFEECKDGLEDLKPYQNASRSADVAYSVRFAPWETDDRPRPANDGGLPDPRHHPVEMLNRSVHIVFNNDGCLRLPDPA